MRQKGSHRIYINASKVVPCLGTISPYAKVRCDQLFARADYQTGIFGSALAARVKKKPRQKCAILKGMVEAKEKWTSKERETLMYSTSERAQKWREGVREKLQAEANKDVRRQREVVAEAVADEFAEAGYAVSLSHPWEHSPEEHDEAQELVNLAFATDLPTALKQAKQSSTWPRNLDLFHDVLTTEMYDLVREYKLNKQPLVGWALFAVGIVVGAALVTTLLIVLGR